MIDTVVISWAANQKLFMSPYSLSSFDGSGTSRFVFLKKCLLKNRKSLHIFQNFRCDCYLYVYAVHEIIYKYLSSLFLSLDYVFFQICLHRLLSFSCCQFLLKCVSCFSCHFKVNKRRVAFWNLHIYLKIPYIYVYHLILYQFFLYST